MTQLGHQMGQTKLHSARRKALVDFLKQVKEETDIYGDFLYRNLWDLVMCFAVVGLLTLPESKQTSYLDILSGINIEGQLYMFGEGYQQTAAAWEAFEKRLLMHLAIGMRYLGYQTCTLNLEHIIHIASTYGKDASKNHLKVSAAPDVVVEVKEAVTIADEELVVTQEESGKTARNHKNKQRKIEKERQKKALLAGDEEPEDTNCDVHTSASHTNESDDEVCTDNRTFRTGAGKFEGSDISNHSTFSNIMNRMANLWNISSLINEEGATGRVRDFFRDEEADLGYRPVSKTRTQDTQTCCVGGRTKNGTPPALSKASRTKAGGDRAV